MVTGYPVLGAGHGADGQRGGYKARGCGPLNKHDGVEGLWRRDGCRRAGPISRPDGTLRADVARDLVGLGLFLGESSSERLDEAFVAFAVPGL